MEPGPDREVVTHELRAGHRTAWDAAVGMWMLTVITWPFAVVLAVPVLVSALGIVSTPWPVMLAFGPLVLGVVLASMVRANRRALSEGTVLTASYAPASLTVSGPLGASEVRYEAITDVSANSRVVRLRLTGGGVLAVPRALVPDDELARLRDHVTRSQNATTATP